MVEEKLKTTRLRFLQDNCIMAEEEFQMFQIFKCCLKRLNNAQAWRNSNLLLGLGFQKIVPVSFAGLMFKDWDMLIFLSNWNEPAKHLAHR